MYTFKVKDKKVAEVLFSVLNGLTTVGADIYEYETKGEKTVNRQSNGKQDNGSKKYYLHVSDNGNNREYAVEQLRKGRSCKDIGDELGISACIIRGYKAHITMGTY